MADRDQEARDFEYRVLIRNYASSACFSQPLEEVTLADAPCSSISLHKDKDLVIKTANILQTLICLNNLMHVNAADPAKVRVYASLAEQKVLALGELIRPMLWNPVSGGETKLTAKPPLAVAVDVARLRNGTGTALSEIAS